MEVRDNIALNLLQMLQVLRLKLLLEWPVPMISLWNCRRAMEVTLVKARKWSFRWSASTYRYRPCSFTASQFAYSDEATSALDYLTERQVC